MPKIYLYAEVLTHIKQLTLHASLQSDKDESPQIDISSDKKVITVVHDGESSSLYLPTQILGNVNLTFETEKKTEIAARVQIEDLQEWNLPDANGNEAPWAAADLTEETAIHCGKCEEPILSSRCVSVWKELPSQDWADVMDLWYCHKPHEHDTAEQQQAAKAKGTSSNSKLASIRGTGMVDVVSFVLNPDDCQNFKITEVDNNNDVQSDSVNCSKCRKLLGTYSTAENLVRLYKSNVKVRLHLNEDLVTYPPAVFICAQLLSMIESSPIRKVIVYNSTPDLKKSQLSKNTAKTQPDDYSQLGLEDPPPQVNSSKQTETDSGAEASTTTPTSTTSSVQNPPTDSTPPTQPEKTPTQSRSDFISNPNPNQPTAPQPLPENSAILLWIFNPDIYYSSSLHPSNISTPNPTNPTNRPSLVHRAMKIFYKPIASPLTTPPQTGTITTEELPLPTQSDVQSLYETLVSSTSILPQTARRFQDEWDVGLLDRYERVATGEKVMEENPLARKVTGDQGDGRVTRWELPEGYRELYM